MMKQNLNKNILVMQEQIDNSLELLRNLNLIHFYNPVSLTHFKSEGITRLSWTNHISGREISSQAFTQIKQYLHLLENGSYHALLKDFSIIRVSFTYEQNLLVSQNLLWWPCPVKIEFEDEDDYSPIEIVKLFLEDIDSFRMRSPIRIDFDNSNDTFDHPRAHIHTQHPESRMNTVGPICFNTFVKFIYNHYYPETKLKNTNFPATPIKYTSNKEIDYVLKEKLILT